MQWFKVHLKIARLIMDSFVFRSLQIKEMYIFIKVTQNQMANTIARLIPLTTQMRQQRSFGFLYTIAGERNVVVLLRWSVNYSTNGVLYPYHYEVKTYRPTDGIGYKLYLDSDKDAALSGYQTKIDGKLSNYALDNAIKIKKYLHSKYGV